MLRSHSLLLCLDDAQAQTEAASSTWPDASNNEFQQARARHLVGSKSLIGSLGQPPMPF